MNIGQKIKNIRKERGLSQEQLAKLCGLNRNSIYNYENGRRSPKSEDLIKIANALDISLNELTKENLSHKILLAAIETNIGETLQEKLFLASKRYNIPMSTLENVYNGVSELTLDKQEMLLESLPASHPQYKDLKLSLVIEYNNKNGFSFSESINEIIQRTADNPQIKAFDSFISMLSAYNIELPGKMPIKQIRQIEKTAIPYIKFLVNEAIKEMPEYIERLTDKKEGE